MAKPLFHDALPEHEAASWLAAVVAERRAAGEWGRVVVEIVVEAGHVATVRRQNDDVRKYAKKKSSARQKHLDNQLT